VKSRLEVLAVDAESSVLTCEIPVIYIQPETCDTTSDHRLIASTNFKVLSHGFLVYVRWL
jgi:hypothetical protein